MVSIFIFRRDFRIADNVGLNMMPDDEPIVPIFIFNSSQIDASKNTYYSERCVQFMLQALDSLEKQIGNNSLCYFHSKQVGDLDVLSELHRKHKIVRIGFNEDYTPFARKRDKIIQDWCKKNGIVCITSRDEYSIIPPDKMKKPALKYTPFYEHNKAIAIKILDKSKRFRFEKISGCVKRDSIVKLKKGVLGLVGTREAGLAILEQIRKGTFKRYGDTRDEPTIPTTRLSAYLKFGCVSIREAALAIRSTNNTILYKELLWRAFYDQITWHFPKTLNGQDNKEEKNHSYYEKYDKISWSQRKDHWKRWITGMTGFPLVDAGMRELAATGYMHNRVRMVVASVLIKNLHIDWREGEKYFATQLIDYHPSANNGGWTFISGTGANAQPYFRTFNPFLQSAKFDKDTAYIKKWVPELRDLTAKDIHQWDGIPGVDYPKPIVDQRLSADAYKNRLGSV